MERMLSKRWLPYLLLALATLAVWAHTVSYEFVYDDRFFIQELASVRSLANVPSMFTDIRAQCSDPYVFVVFRPLRTAHYALLCFLGGKELPQPWIYHLANVLWHGGVAAMLFAVATRLFARLCPDWTDARARAWALFAALAFAVHPVVSEVVCWAKSLDDLMATFFALAALRELLRPPEELGPRVRALACFALAVYSKESAVPFALLVLPLLRTLHALPWRRCAARAGEFALVALLYVVHRRLVLGRTSQVAPLSGTYLQTLLDMLPVVPRYVRLLFGVPPFRVDYGDFPGGYALASPAVWSGLVLLVALGAAGIVAWRSARARPAGFGLLWTGLFLLPVSNLVPMMQYMAERFLYLPLVGWVLALTTALALIPARRVARVLAPALLVVWGLLARERSLIWRDEYTLFVTSFHDGLHSPRVEHNVEAALFHLPGIARVTVLDPDTGRLQVARAPDEAAQALALADYERALAILPDNVALLSGYATTLGNAGRHEQAIQTYERVVQLKPKNGFYWQNLAGALLFTGALERARDAAARAAAILPGDAGVLALQTEIEWRAGNYAAARGFAQRWRTAKPGEDNARRLEEIEAKLREPR